MFHNQINGFDESFPTALPSTLLSDASAEISCPIRGECDFSCTDTFPLAMAYVPMQQFDDMYDPAEGHAVGTLFRALDKPFRGGKANRGGMTR